MTQRYFLKLSYKGTSFCGWQKQNNGNSVQACIEKALSTLLRSEIDIVGAGRTDSGVHARNYIAHFDATEQIRDLTAFQYHLNQLLPFEIAIQEIVPVRSNAHARFDALSRSYEYHCVFCKNPFETEFSYHLHYPIDLDVINEASDLLLHYSDFTSFCKLHSDNKTNICKIAYAYWFREGEKLIFEITADRFLRNMVRALVGTLLKVGSKKMTIGEFKNIIEVQDRAKASTSAPAHGLFFVGVNYPEKVFIID